MTSTRAIGYGARTQFTTGSNADRTGPRGPAHVIIGQRRAAKYEHSAPSRAAIFKLLRAEDHDGSTVSISVHALIINNH